VLTPHPCLHHVRSYTIATYALCGFANFPSIGIQIGGFGAMAEGRKSDIAQIALRSPPGKEKNRKKKKEKEKEKKNKKEKEKKKENEKKEKQN
jgi:hypothetical protein